MSLRSQALIQFLKLQPHPEGGYYRETYRSGELLFHPDNADGRSLLTNIYFLIEKNNFSAFHRIDSDELWYYHEGAACTIHVLKQDGVYSQYKLGNNVQDGEVFQAVVNAGDWFASETTGDYTLVGCAVAPGFDFTCLEIADRKKLILAFPEHPVLIERLTRN